jgi:hypothetical protein
MKNFWLKKIAGISYMKLSENFRVKYFYNKQNRFQKWVCIKYCSQSLETGLKLAKQSGVDRYSARRLMESWLIESAAYCNQIFLAQFYINNSQNTSVIWIIRLLLSLLYRPRVILLSGGHYIWFGDAVGHFWLKKPFSFKFFCELKAKTQF